MVTSAHPSAGCTGLLRSTPDTGRYPLIEQESRYATYMNEAERRLLDVLNMNSTTLTGGTYSRPLAESASKFQRIERVERYLAILLDGDPSSSRIPSVESRMRAADLHLRNGNNEVSLAEVVLVETRKNLSNRTASLVAASVELRRSYPSEILLGAVFVVPKGTGDDGRLMAVVKRQILRGVDHVGYDWLLVCSFDESIEWHFIRAAASAESQQEFRLISIEEVRNCVFDLALTEFSDAGLREGFGASSNGILLICDEWGSSRGGISTVNRELAVALACEGADVYVMVPSAVQAEVDEAQSLQVKLVSPAEVPGLSANEHLLLRPIFADRAWSPAIIVGHGRVLGPYALALKNVHFPAAKRVHIVHTDAEELESAKRGGSEYLTMEKTENKRTLERYLAASANLTFGVGPLLTDSIKDEIRGREKRPPVECLTPGLRGGFQVDPYDPPVKNQVLFVGRTEDFQSKGIDIVATAVDRLAREWLGSPKSRPMLIIRGVPAESESKIDEQLRQIVLDDSIYRLRPFVDSVESINEDLHQAQVVVMPSRHEGFGLVALEAISCGVPVLVSSDSGIAQMMSDLNVDSVPSSIVAVRDAPGGPTAVDEWERAISRILQDPVAARKRAQRLRAGLSVECDWHKTAVGLIRRFAELD